MPNVSSLTFIQLNTPLFQLNDVCCEKSSIVFFYCYYYYFQPQEWTKNNTEYINSRNYLMLKKKHKIRILYLENVF